MHLSALQAYMSGHHWLVGVYYSVYKEATVNVFALTSTWLMVVMAIGRYVVVCRPLHARGYISLSGTRFSIGAVFVMSVLLNVPRMFRYDVISSSCTELDTFPDSGRLDNCSCFIFSKVVSGCFL